MKEELSQSKTTPDESKKRVKERENECDLKERLARGSEREEKWFKTLTRPAILKGGGVIYFDSR